MKGNGWGRREGGCMSFFFAGIWTVILTQAVLARRYGVKGSYLAKKNSLRGSSPTKITMLFV